MSNEKKEVEKEVETETKKEVLEELSKPTEAEQYVSKLSERAREASELEYQIPPTPRAGFARELRDKAMEAVDTAKMMLSDKTLWNLLASGEMDINKILVLNMIMTENMMRNLMMQKMLGVTQDPVTNTLKTIEERIKALEEKIESTEKSKLIDELRNELTKEINELRKAIKSRRKTSVKAYIDRKIGEILNEIRSKAPKEEVSPVVNELRDLKELLKDLAEKGRKEEIKSIVNDLKQAIEKSGSIKEALGLIREIRKTMEEFTGPTVQSPRTTTFNPAIYEGKLPIWMHPDAIKGTKELIQEVVGAVTEQIKEILRTYIAVKEGVPEITEKELKEELPELPRL